MMASGINIKLILRGSGRGIRGFSHSSDLRKVREVRPVRRLRRPP